MAFSLFGKKPQPAPAKPAVKATPASRPAAEAPPASAPREELESLDFTSPDALSFQEDQDAHVEIRESAPLTHPVIEEAAILYANGQDSVALNSLETAVAANNLGAATNQAWAMLFDLYQLMGKREAFEQRALEYSVKFEKSPPTWVETRREPINPALTTGGHAFVEFTGRLGETADKQVRQLEKIIAKSPMARVEFSKLQDVDVLGAALLLKAMKAARKARCELVLGGAPRFAQLLAQRIETGKRDGEELWLLLLELYQHVGEQEPFEEWALNYAITFEVSPPSWEARPAPRKAAPAVPAEAAGPDVFPLTGEMYSAGSDAFQRLLDFASAREQVLIDCSSLKRMDFVSAGMFLNTLTNLQVMGKAAQIRCANQLLCALFGVLGIDQVAQIELRRI